MSDELQSPKKTQTKPSTTTTTTNTTTSTEKSQQNHDLSEEGDAKAWETFDWSFRQVQSVLDKNRALIWQVNENHQSKIADNMVKNVALIQEINGNISKVASLYSDLSSNFSSIFHQKMKNVKGEKVDY